MTFHGPHSRRAVPQRPSDAQRDALRRWLGRDDRWVLRPVWERWLREQNDDLQVHIDRLTHDQHFAARAWLVQQRHALHAAVEGGPAPDGWLESLPLYKALNERLRAAPRH
jgi:hypothetical protein